MFTATKTNILGQNIVFFPNPDQVVYVPTPNQSKITLKVNYNSKVATWKT